MPSEGVLTFVQLKWKISGLGCISRIAREKKGFDSLPCKI